LIIQLRGVTIQPGDNIIAKMLSQFFQPGILPETRQPEGTTRYEFNSLNDDDEKLAAVLYNGEYVAMRDVDDVKITLYQLPTFYVEIYCGEKNEKGIRFRSFSSLESLKPYLEQIDISKLV
jgi:hypothetical protein